MFYRKNKRSKDIIDPLIFILILRIKGFLIRVIYLRRMYTFLGGTIIDTAPSSGSFINTFNGAD
jgi:hypothetical protein